MTDAPVSLHPLEYDETVELLHAVMARVARDVGARTLVLKGPIATAQGVRLERPAADLDVFVEPTKVDAVAHRLREVGWSSRDTSANAQVVAQHSASFAHPAWPCEIDLHHAFPGFFTEPGTLFEALWERHDEVSVAHAEVAVPDLVGQAAVVGLHSLRQPLLDRNRADLEHVHAVLPGLLDEQQKRELAELAARTGAADTLAPVLDAIGAPRLGRGTTSEADLETWRIQTGMARTHSVTWVAELARQPWSRWPGLVWRAAWLTDADVRARHPDASPTRLGLLGARLRRLAEGVRDLPRAVRLVRPWRRRLR